MRAGSYSCKLFLRTTEEDEGTLTAVNEISVDAALVAVLSQLDAVFFIKTRTKIGTESIFLVDMMFFFFCLTTNLGKGLVEHRSTKPVFNRV